jgi:hypothetical protein
MKRLFFPLLLLCSATVLGQPHCAIGFIDSSNRIAYNQAAIEAIIQPAGYAAFFLGESHTVDFEPEFKFHFIRHLHARYGVKDVFMEIGYAAAYFFNQYLQTGDTAILTDNRLLYLWGHYKDFWYNLAAYNRLQPDSSKIRIHGIDFERTEIFKLLEKAKPAHASLPEHLQATFADIQNLSADKELFVMDKQFKKALIKLRSTFLRYEDDFKVLYQQNFPVVYKAITNEVPITPTVNPRNKVWLENIKNIIAQYNIHRFIGFFGGAHTRYNNPTSLTVALRQSHFFSGKIVNIATMYHHFISTGGDKQVVAYGYKEKDVFEQFYDKSCRAVIIPSATIPTTTFKTASDFVLMAKEVVDR